jgi:membrane protein
MNFASARKRLTGFAEPFLETKTGRIAKQLWKESNEDDISGLSAEMAYRLLLALFPFFIFLGAVGGFAADIAGAQNPTNDIMDWIGDALPTDARSVLQGQLHAILDSYDLRLLSFGAIGAAWGATAAMSTMIKGLNRAYDVEETRPFLKRTALQLGLTTLLVVFLLGSFVILLAGQLFASEIGSAFGLSGFAASAFALLRFPIVFVLLTAVMAFIYWAAPTVHFPFRWVSPGAVMFIVTWILATAAFSFYVSHFGSYQTTYGTLGGVIVLLAWLSLTSYLMLLGAELNAILQANVAPEKIRGGQLASGHAGTVARKRKAARASR